MIKTAKITSKGQVTIPADIRDILDTDIIEFEVKDGEIIIRPVKSVAGSLAEYAKGRKSFNEVREKTWDKVVKEKKQ